MSNWGLKAAGSGGRVVAGLSGCLTPATSPLRCGTRAALAHQQRPTASSSGRVSLPPIARCRPSSTRFLKQQSHSEAGYFLAGRGQESIARPRKPLLAERVTARGGARYAAPVVLAQHSLFWCWFALGAATRPPLPGLIDIQPAELLTHSLINVSIAAVANETAVLTVPSPRVFRCQSL